MVTDRFAENVTDEITTNSHQNDAREKTVVQTELDVRWLGDWLVLLRVNFGVDFRVNG